VATFGPVDLHVDSKTYGFITKTPKPSWANFDVLGYIRSGLGGQPVFGFDTDVNGAALAMAYHFSHLPDRQPVSSLAYITVGTGVGVGILSHDKLVHGLLHPEMGHIYVPRSEDESTDFRGTCPYHGGCVEGMCSSGALSKRANVPASELANLGDDHPMWALVAHYLAHLCYVLMSTVSPQIIVIGGGIMQREILFPMIRKKAAALCNGYLDIDIDAVIQPSPYDQNAGIIGSAALAACALNK